MILVRNKEKINWKIMKANHFVLCKHFYQPAMHLTCDAHMNATVSLALITSHFIFDSTFMTPPFPKKCQPPANIDAITAVKAYPPSKVFMYMSLSNAHVRKLYKEQPQKASRTI